jgi:lipoate-protein ligase A
MHQNTGEASGDPERELEHDWNLFQAVETGSAGGFWRCWRAMKPVVVIGRHNAVRETVFEDACRADNVNVLTRFSGGGAVILGPGSLNYAVAVPLDSRPDLVNVEASVSFVLRTIVGALGVPGLRPIGGDLTLGGRKVSGSAQRRGRRALIQHGTLLYDFDARLATRYLKEPARRPAYRAARCHAEFMGNLPLSADEIRGRLETAWADLLDNAKHPLGHPTR